MNRMKKKTLWYLVDTIPVDIYQSSNSNKETRKTSRDAVIVFSC